MTKERRVLIPDVKKVLDRVADAFAEESRHSFQCMWEDQDIDVGDESPIEQMFSVGLSYGLRSGKHFGYCGGFSISPSDGRGIETARREGFLVRTQQPIGRYRADFYISYRHYTGVVVSAVVECDGHDFHERTKEQARHDKERDRYFQSLGLLVLRYTGSEIYADPVKCALDALGIIFNRADEAIRDGG